MTNEEVVLRRMSEQTFIVQGCAYLKYSPMLDNDVETRNMG